MTTRLEMLCQQANREVSARLESEYNRLVHPDEMGAIYKVFYIGRESNGNFIKTVVFLIIYK